MGLSRPVAALVLILALGAVLAACGGGDGKGKVILATTTSTMDSGLLEVLLPEFEEETGYRVTPIAVGTGQALAMGERGEADVLLVHAPTSEQEFMDAGHGVDRRLVMHNDFVIVGPEDDPAGIAAAASAADALARIAGAGAVFVSRGDDSGTHKLELSLWKEVGIDPEGGSWYVQSGQGMGATLGIANDRRGYTISDRATYLAQRDHLQLSVLLEGDAALLNIYHVIQVNPAKNDQINEDGAKAFVEFMVGGRAQALVGEFGVEEFGEPLFTADAGKDEASLK